VTYLYARQFADRLLELGAVGLKAEIEVKNRAAIRVAKAAGFVEQTRNDEWVVLTRLPNG
jgi:RimJ/RimL family protein N-acetyltransferase